MPGGLQRSSADFISLALRIVRARRSVDQVLELPQTGVCTSCGQRSYFVRNANEWLLRLMEAWPYDAATLTSLATRENYFCIWCGRSYRMRVLAAVSRRWLSDARVYEPATFGVFSRRMTGIAKSFVTSEYLGDAPAGAIVAGRHHEDIRSLSFASDSFDLVITSEVFEHVEDPWRGFAEVRRVLRPGGRHVFTVPMVLDQPTLSRKGLPPIYHIDPLRSDGSLVVTDFGDDLPELLADYGFRTVTHDFPNQGSVARVFESVAM